MELLQRIGPLLAAALMALTAFAVAPQAYAIGGDQALVYRGGARGKVVFDGRVHAAKGFDCKTCHTSFEGTDKVLFVTRKTAEITRADHDTDTKCFACHDGEKVFATCGGCHRGVPNN